METNSIESPQSQNIIQRFENEFEYMKAIKLLENKLVLSEQNANSTTKLYNDLKAINEKTRKECENLNNKLVGLHNEISVLDKKHEDEIEILKKDFERKKEVYEKKILKLSEFNPENLRYKVENEVSEKFKESLLIKESQIKQLVLENKELKFNLELLKSEYETYKIDIGKEIICEKELHQNEINNLMAQFQLKNFGKAKRSDSTDKDLLLQMKNELERNRHKINELNSQYEAIRAEKDALTVERNELRLQSMKTSLTYKSLTLKNFRLKMKG